MNPICLRDRPAASVPSEKPRSAAQCLYPMAGQGLCEDRRLSGVGRMTLSIAAGQNSALGWRAEDRVARNAAACSLATSGPSAPLRHAVRTRAEAWPSSPPVQQSRSPVACAVSLRLNDGRLS